MNLRALAVSILGFAGVVIPARATFSFKTDSPSFDNSVNGTTGLSLDSSIIFSSLDLISSSEYLDSNGVDFKVFRSGGSFADLFTLSSNTLVTHTGGDLIEITLPPNIVAAGLNLTFTGSFLNLCVGFSAGDCSYNPPVVSPGPGSSYAGLINSAPFTVWLTPNNQATLAISSYELGAETPTPEAHSLALLGSGLVFLGLLRRRIRPAAPSAQS